MKKFICSILTLLFLLQTIVPLNAFASSFPSIDMKSIDANLGETVKIPVKISSQSNLLGFKLTFDYDSKILTPISVDYGDVISGGLQDNLEGDAVAGSFNVYWAGSAPITKEGVLFYVSFKVSDKVFPKTYVKLSYSQEDTFDDDFNDVELILHGSHIGVNDEGYKYADTRITDAQTRLETSKEINAGDVFYLFPDYIDYYDSLTEITEEINYDTNNFEVLGWAKYNYETCSDFVLFDNIPCDNSGKISLTMNLTDSYVILHNSNDYKLTAADFDNTHTNFAICLKAKDNCFSGDYEFTCEATHFAGVDAVSSSKFNLKVNSTPTSETANIYSDEISAQYNDEIDIPIYISNNHGLMGYRLNVEYNPNELEIISTSCGDKFNGTYNDNAGDTLGKFDILWNNTENTVENGVLANLKFKVLAKDKSTSTVKLSYTQADTFNEKYSDVKFNTKDITLNLNEVAEPDLKDFIIKTISLSLESSITMNYKVLKSAVQDYTDLAVTFNCADLKEVKVTDYTEQGNYYVFSYPGISPQMMGDTVTGVLTAKYKENGKTYSSPEKKLSVKEYAYIMLDRYSSDSYAKLRTLLVDLLNYGASAQKYKNYKTSSLVNADLTDTQKAWGTSKSYDFVDVRDYNYKTISAPSVSWVGSGLVLNNSVMVRAKFKTDNIENKTVKITCNSRTFTYKSEDFTSNNDGTYYVYCNEIYANEMSKNITLTVYDNGVQCSNTMLYSIESYANAVQNSAYKGTALDDLTQAMMRYGKSAEAYRA